MKETPIIFNADMVRAILDGKKTQTRRIFKQAVGSSLSVDYEYPWATLSWLYGDGPGHEVYERTLKMQCPYGKIGDQLWVREAFSDLARMRERFASAIGRSVETITTSFEGDIAYRASLGSRADYLKWTPSIHMPRWASRITLEIIDIRVERLQDISEEDAIAEGVSANEFSPACYAFGSLWQFIYGVDNPQSWQANPWVWVIEFRRV
ncbi:hypothetical protein [Xenorhabdus bovienii]|uniref:Uncharacterized protein n=1 Tax=Xenorhabdus bovienii str. Intermedium TaxID=1379677 RepID=A0A077QKK3_XENBV|nr:hypothetical protein [Xenorhabdus bovienii]CDH33775.1 conserved hypothetical protein [Xenorhabdus bovienii str. Intermedium]